MEVLHIIKLIILILSILFTFVFLFLYAKFKKFARQDSASDDDTVIDSAVIKRFVIFFYCYCALLFANIVIQILEFILNFSYS